MRIRYALTVVLAVISIFSKSAHAENAPTYNEKYRPQFHFTAPHGWLNDPNGLVYYDGEYHLFYQHNPKGTGWASNLYWGHAISRDLIHWRNLPTTLPPTPIDGNNFAGSWSGSGFVDPHHLTGKTARLYLMWTAAGLGQCLAYSDDRGRTFTRVDGNPVIRGARTGDYDRDPKVYWHELTKRWVMAYSISGEGVVINSSVDLANWTRESKVDGLFECPDFFELPVDGDAGKEKWVIWDASGKYYIGTFDGHKFAAESGPFLIDHGRNCYASQTWDNAPNGRRISLGWMRDGNFPGMPFNQQMAIPCELQLRTLPQGIRLTKSPVKELEQLRYDAREITDRNFGHASDLLNGLPSDALDLEMEIELHNAGEINLNIRGMRIQYVPGVLKCGDSAAPLEMVNGRFKLRVLVDRTSVEVFGNDGAASLSMSFAPPEENKKLELSADRGMARLVSMHAYKMHSAWTLKEDRSPPPAPTGVKAISEDAHTTTISWEPVADDGAGIRAYFVYRAGEKISEVKTIENGATRITIPGDEKETGVAYEVSAVNGWEMEGPKSEGVKSKNR